MAERVKTMGNRSKLDDRRAETRSAIASLRATPPPAREPASQRVGRRLLELVRSGNLRAGDRLPTEHELADALEVSRPVVREALRGLGLMGVVESRQGGGAFVTDLSPARLASPLQLVLPLNEDNVGALYEARRAVECEMVQMGADRIAPSVAARLRELVRLGHEAVDDPVAFRVVDREFHAALTGLAGNPFLDRIAASLYEIGMEYRRVASETPGVTASSAVEHEAIVEAIEARDPKAAAAAMDDHLASIARTTEEAMRLLRENEEVRDAS